MYMYFKSDMLVLMQKRRGRKRVMICVFCANQQYPGLYESYRERGIMLGVLTLIGCNATICVGLKQALIF